MSAFSQELCPRPSLWQPLTLGFCPHQPKRQLKSKDKQRPFVDARHEPEQIVDVLPVDFGQKTFLQKKLFFVWTSKIFRHF